MCTALNIVLNFIVQFSLTAIIENEVPVMPE